MFWLRCRNARQLSRAFKRGNDRFDDGVGAMPDECKRLGAAFERERMRDQRLEPELAGFDELDNSRPSHSVRKCAEHLEIA